MSFDAYSVAVRLKLSDAVSSGLAIIGQGLRNTKRDADGVQASLTSIEARMRGIKSLGLLGGALAGAGAFGLSLFEVPLKAAREYELAFTKFKTLNLGDAVNKHADDFARGANLMGISAKQLMTTMSESVGLFGSFAEAQKLAPKIAALNAANSAIFGGKIGGIDEGASRSLMKFIDRRGGTKDDASFMRNLDLAQKLVTGSGGFVQFKDLDAFSQQGGTAFRGLSDAGVLNMALLLQEQGGSRAGTSFMSLYQNLIAGRTPKKTMAMLQEFGLGHLGYQTHATVGGHALKSLIMTDIKGGDLLQADPATWFRSVFLPALAGHGVTSEGGILKATNDLLSNRTASSQASIMTTQLLQLARDANLAKGAMGYDATIGAWKDDPNSKYANLQARWTDAMRELGLVVLPTAIKGIELLTTGLKNVASFAHEFPNLTKGALLAGGALAGLAAAGGTLMLATAGFRAVGLALNVLTLGGAGGMIGSLATGLAGLGTVLAPLLGSLAAAGVVGYGAYKIGTALGLGNVGEWLGGQAYEFMHPNEGSFIAPSGRRASGQVTVINLDGKQIARVVTKHQTSAMEAPQAGPSFFDMSRALAPAGGGSY